MRRLRAERRLLLNAGSLLGTSAITALLGAGFWLLAARRFSQDAVGLSSAAVSAMTLLGFLATVGLGTLLMGELPRRRDHGRSLIAAAIAVAAAIGAALGLGFALIAPSISSNLDLLRATPAAALAFAAGAALTGAGFVLDQALIGLLRGGLQLARNVVFSLAKLLGLLAVAALSANAGGAWIYATWAVGIAVSLLVLAPFFARAEGGPRRPGFAALAKMRAAAATHHAFNLALRVPDLALPVIVVTLLSAATNAAFFVAWMIANLCFALPLALSTVLYAVGSGETARLTERFRLTVWISLVFGLAANLFLLPAAAPLLGAFGAEYADQATAALHILALGIFAETIRTHYVAVHRIERRIAAALPIVWGGTALELAGGAAGALLGGLTGVAAGWLAAVCVEAAVMAPDVVRALGRRPRPQPPTAVSEGQSGAL
jgi:O-antigen/teichoic acid export membrane protein